MYQYPHTIQNKYGEKLTFLRLVNDPAGDWLETEASASPGAGPITHVHWKQEESLTVVSGKMATQIPGEAPIYYGPGETVTFNRGTWHRFWNPGEEVLQLKGWVKPANNVEYFLTEMYKAIDAGKDGRPEINATTFLMMHYRSEFGAYDIPGFVKKVIMPMKYYMGKLSGGFKQFKDAPLPLK